jgi:hypothetical protein
VAGEAGLSGVPGGLGLGLSLGLSGWRAGLQGRHFVQAVDGELLRVRQHGVLLLLRFLGSLLGQF